MPPNLESRLTSENETSKTHSGWHQLSVKMIHSKSVSRRRRELRRYENTSLEGKNKVSRAHSQGTTLPTHLELRYTNKIHK